MFQSALELTHPPIPCALGTHSVQVKGWGLDTDHTCHTVHKDNFILNFMVNQTFISILTNIM